MMSHYRCTVIYPGYIIPGYFSELSSIHEIHRAVQEFLVRQLVCTDTCMGFKKKRYFSESLIFPSQDTIRSIVLFTMYYLTSFYCNKYLFIPTLRGNLKFHNYSIHNHTEHGRLGVFLRRATRSHPILRKDKFTTNINL